MVFAPNTQLDTGNFLDTGSSLKEDLSQAAALLAISVGGAATVGGGSFGLAWAGCKAGLLPKDKDGTCKIE